MSEIPPDLHYTTDHEWVRRTGDDTVRVGITDFAQSALGDVVFVRLPEVGDELTAGEAFGEVESTKSVSDLYAPVSAKVVAVNEDLDGSPRAGQLRAVRRRLADRPSSRRRARSTRVSPISWTPRHTAARCPSDPCYRSLRPATMPARPGRRWAASRCSRRSGGGRHIGLLCAVRSSHRRSLRVGSRPAGPNQTTQQRPVRSSG